MSFSLGFMLDSPSCMLWLREGSSACDSGCISAKIGLMVYETSAYLLSLMTPKMYFLYYFSELMVMMILSLRLANLIAYVHSLFVLLKFCRNR